MRVLAVADEIRESLYGPDLKALEPDLIVSCGDLPFDYLEYLVTVSGVPLVYVLGNHDPSLVHRPPASGLLKPDYLESAHRPLPGPQGCTSAEGRWVDVAGLRVAGLGGSVRYSEGPHQFDERQMRKKVRNLTRRIRMATLLHGARPDIVITHSPPRGSGDRDDPAHVGFECFRRLVEVLEPRYLIHGHVHPHGGTVLDHRIGSTQIVNAVGYRLLEFER